MVQSNLPPESQQWGREIEKRIRSLEIGAANTDVAAKNNRATLSSVQNSVEQINQLSTTLSYGSRSVVLKASRPSMDEYVVVEGPSWALSCTVTLTIIVSNGRSRVDVDVSGFNPLNPESFGYGPALTARINPDNIPNPVTVSRSGIMVDDRTDNSVKINFDCARASGVEESLLEFYWTVNWSRLPSNSEDN